MRRHHAETDAVRRGATAEAGSPPAAGDDARGGSTPEPRLGRRAVVLAGLGLMLGGCGSSASSRGLLGVRMPEVPWDAVGRGESAEARLAAPEKPRGSIPSSSSSPSQASAVRIAGLRTRAVWGAAPTRTAVGVDRMLPIRWITIHHEGIAFRGRTATQVRDRIRLIQQSHQRSWADIGYHFIVDPQGRVWEGRPLRLQGAHVRDANEGNVGVMLMGNFEEQSPTTDQLAGLQRTVVALQRAWGVPLERVRTHKEWPSAATLCPGRHLQSRVEGLRARRAFA